MALHEQYFKRTADNLPAAQYYDSELDELIPQRGKDGAIYVSSIKSSSKTDTLQNAAVANGNGTPQDIEGYASAAVQVSGTFSATISFEGSVDGINYVPLLVLDQTGSPVTSTTAPGIYRVDCAGLKAMRTPITNRVSGAVTVVSRLLPEARPTNLGVQLSGRKVQVDVIANAVSLAPGAAGEWSMGMTTEQDLYLIVDCDKAGWRLTVEQPWSTSATPDGLYPRYENAAATPVGYPKVARVIIPGANPQNGTEAANLAIGAWNINRTCRLLNQHTTDTATITIRALRIWR